MNAKAIGAALVLAAVAAGAAWWWWRMRNVKAFAALVRYVESKDDYAVIAGGDHFSDFSEHPFIVNPNRARPAGTTASGAYQYVRATWIMARDALALPDFSPASQDAAFPWLLKYKVPGQSEANPEGTGNFELVAQGRFNEAIVALGAEWQSLSLIAQGRYWMKLATALDYIRMQGGTYDAAAAA